MRGFRLNGWQRIGIVASVLWAIGGWLWAMKELSRPALIDHTAVYLACARAQARAQLTDTPDIRTCEKVLQQNRAEEAALKPEQVTHNLTLATLIALVPIPIAWLLAYVVLALVRWVRRGFQPAS